MSSPPSHPLVAFYRDGAQDDRGRTLNEILAWPDDRLEAVHDFIQWLFPLPERSGANPGAPTLDAATIEAFHATPAMRASASIMPSSACCASMALPGKPLPAPPPSSVFPIFASERRTGSGP